MKRCKYIFLPVILILLMLSSTVPAFAASWQEDEKGSKYIDDDGNTATGWVDFEGDTYYLDKNGYRKEDSWIKYKGGWYYLDDEGVKATDTWIDNYYVDETGKHTKTR